MASLPLVSLLEASSEYSLVSEAKSPPSWSFLRTSSARVLASASVRVTPAGVESRPAQVIRMWLARTSRSFFNSSFFSSRRTRV